MGEKKGRVNAYDCARNTNHKRYCILHVIFAMFMTERAYRQWSQRAHPDDIWYRLCARPDHFGYFIYLLVFLRSFSSRPFLRGEGDAHAHCEIALAARSEWCRSILLGSDAVNSDSAAITNLTEYNSDAHRVRISFECFFFSLFVIVFFMVWCLSPVWSHAHRHYHSIKYIE